MDINAALGKVMVTSLLRYETGYFFSASNGYVIFKNKVTRYCIGTDTYKIW
jgi:hypothetical protein